MKSPRIIFAASMLIAGAAQAQSSVTLFGLIDTSLALQQ